ncbi:LOW QUALITY PROTEIN: reverse transcriptase [Phytophthora megakarya]|uniref:Reverse transcriptase n=1 Tax=Phytophthora megakarya TaxID=4795 RepID=A0A225VM82_9STRA|nr:LOW QUALITY PROTEIN: reverse transcriptase [Phytophthora megakarya]
MRPTDRDLAGRGPRATVSFRSALEWQNLVLEATIDTRPKEIEVEVPLMPRWSGPSTKPRAYYPGDLKRSTSDLELTWDSDQDYDECVYYHEGSDQYAEDFDSQMAVLPEVPVTTEDIEAIQLCRSGNRTQKQLIDSAKKSGKFRHLLIGKGNSLLPVARGVVCDIDVGGTRPIALKCCKLRIQVREKLADLNKGLLSAKMINYSRSPGASLIVVIIKKNGVDIRFWIDYRLVNSLTQLIIYPRLLINDLLEDLESTLRYCSMVMASGFWVVKITDRAHLISAFITPFVLFEWNRMPFGLKNALHIY